MCIDARQTNVTSTLRAALRTKPSVESCPALCTGLPVVAGDDLAAKASVSNDTEVTQVSIAHFTGDGETTKGQADEASFTSYPATTRVESATGVARDEVSMHVTFQH